MSDTLREALEAFIEASDGDGARLYVYELRAILAAHPAPETVTEAEWQQVADDYSAESLALAAHPVEGETEVVQYQAGCGSWDCRAPECGAL